MERFKNLFGRKSKEAPATPKQIMYTEMLRVVQQLRVFYINNNLSWHRAKNVEFGKDYLILCTQARQTLLQMLHESVLTDLDPDYTWYEKEISFDNGYEVTVMCKQGATHGNPEKLFEVAVYKLGEICYDGHSDVHGHLSFEDVGELLHKIRNLPPAETNDAGGRPQRIEKYEKLITEMAKKNADKGSQGPEQEEANPYEVPTGPT